METDSDQPLFSATNDDDDCIIVRPPEKKRNFPLEIALAAIFMATSLSDSVLTNQISYQTCTVTLNFNESDCRLLGTQNQTQEIKDLETKTQPYTANIQMTKAMIENVIPAFLCLFIGPWSDKYGRKPVLKFAIFGFVILFLNYTIVAFLSTTMAVTPWAYLIGSIFIALTGGNSSLMTAILASVGDGTDDSNRDYKMGLIGGSIYGGLFIGSISSSFVYHLTSGPVVFCISSALMVLTFGYIIFCIRESIEHDDPMMGTWAKYRELFRWDHFINLLKVCFKRRRNYDRSIMLMLIGVLVMSVGVLEGSGPINFLFFRQKLNWTITAYTIFSAWCIALQVVGMGSGTLIVKFGLSGSVLAVLAYVSYSVGSFVFSVASTTSTLYIILGVTFLKAAAMPMAQSMLSKIVDKSDLGKVFSLTTSLELFSALFAAPLYSSIYKSTLATFPGAVFVLSGFIYLGCAFVVLATIMMMRRARSIDYVNINDSSVSSIQ